MEVTVRVPAIDKLLDITASGIGAIAGPMLAPWRARREAEAKKIAARADANILAVLAEGQAGALAVIAAAQESARQQLTAPGVLVEGELTIAEAVEQRVRFQEEKRQRNISAIVSQATEQLTTDEVEDYEPDHDWTARFFNEAQDVSSEEMQLLWAKVLAGEVERPGSTSLRTLSILRDLDRQTAVLFQVFCSAAVVFSRSGESIADMRVPLLGGHPGANSLAEYDMNYDALNVLNEHGLIISGYNSIFDYRICIGVTDGAGNRVRFPFDFQNRRWVLEPFGQPKFDEPFDLDGVAATRSGRELSRVISLEPMPKYTEALMEFFERHELRMVQFGTEAPYQEWSGEPTS